MKVFHVNLRKILHDCGQSKEPNFKIKSDEHIITSLGDENRAQFTFFLRNYLQLLAAVNHRLIHTDPPSVLFGLRGRDLFLSAR